MGRRSGQLLIIVLRQLLSKRGYVRCTSSATALPSPRYADQQALARWHGSSRMNRSIVESAKSSLSEILFRRRRTGIISPRLPMNDGTATKNVLALERSLYRGHESLDSVRSSNSARRVKPRELASPFSVRRTSGPSVPRAYRLLLCSRHGRRNSDRRCDCRG
jgi:hypothetical protein